ncbi:MAG: DUF928 domain-containing protein [Leptolyngbyaceae cyanobacterium RU_5_1]|nr:DUF928 domain-containing protein [Leptolyngbyaceae cyanobacterium RU_5_1]
MRLSNSVAFLKRWVGVCLGLMICSLSVAAIAVEFKPPKRGIPGRREGAGTRGPACVQGSSVLTALVPQTNLGLTTAEYPRFFWYVPKTRAKLLKFSLYQGNEQDPEQELVYETTMNITGEPGVASLALPNDEKVAPLTLGQDYYWSVTLVCSADDPINNMQVSGWVQRVAVPPGLENQLATAKPSDRVSLYANNGLWFDTVTTLATLRCEQPKNSTLVSSWVALLKSVKLDKIADQPLISCTLFPVTLFPVHHVAAKIFVAKTVETA